MESTQNNESKKKSKSTYTSLKAPFDSWSNIDSELTLERTKPHIETAVNIRNAELELSSIEDQTGEPLAQLSRDEQAIKSNNSIENYVHYWLDWGDYKRTTERKEILKEYLSTNQRQLAMTRKLGQLETSGDFEAASKVLMQLPPNIAPPNKSFYGLLNYLQAEQLQHMVSKKGFSLLQRNTQEILISILALENEVSRQKLLEMSLELEDQEMTDETMLKIARKVS
jgi:hypothetical protein